MERKSLVRISGILFLVGAVFGFMITIGLLITLWVNKSNVTARVTGTVSLAGSGLAATHELITVAGSTLDQAAADIDTVDELVMDVASSLEDTSSMISSTGELVGSNMVDFVTNTQTSLASVQNSARAVDSILNKINSIPLLGPWLGNGYDPEVPLQASVAEVSRSLDPLPDALAKISRDLDVSSANLDTVRAEIEVLAKQVGAIQTSLEDAQNVVEKYRVLLDDVQARYDAFEKRLPGMINTVYLVSTAILLWMLLVQSAMLVYGIYLIG